VYLLLTTALCRCYRCWRKHKWNAEYFIFNQFTHFTGWHRPYWWVLFYFQCQYHA